MREHLDGVKIGLDHAAAGGGLLHFGDESRLPYPLVRCAQCSDKVPRWGRAVQLH